MLGAGEMWEITITTIHAVDNQSNEDRIHLIIDWVPEFTVRPEDRILKPVENTGAIPAGAAYQGKIVGRNQPSPCNSGKKFKRCYGATAKLS